MQLQKRFRLCLWNSWDTLTDAVRNGGLVRQRPVEGRDDEWFAGFIAAMHGRAAKEAPELSAGLTSQGFSEQNQALFHKVSNALNPGGKIVISDFIMNDDRISPPFGAVFALNMIVNTPSGDTYTESEVKSWMQATGMSFVERSEGVMIGKKD